MDGTGGGGIACTGASSGVSGVRASSAALGASTGAKGGSSNLCKVEEGGKSIPSPLSGLAALKWTLHSSATVQEVG